MLAGLLVGVQLVVFAGTESEALRLLWQGREWFAGPARPDVAYLTIAAARDLGALEPRIPQQARVLVVTSSPFVVPYDFYLAPRPLTVLMRLDPALIERYAAAMPAVARQASRFLRQFEERGQSLTDEHLRAALPQADYVIVFQGDAATVGLPRPDLLPPAARLELVAREGQSTLYRLMRS